MSDTADFAVAGSISQDFLNSALRVLTATYAPGYGFTLPGAFSIGGRTVAVSGSLAMLAPQVSLAARHDNQISVTVTAGGDVTLVAGKVPVGTPPTELTVVVSATVLVGVFAVAVPTSDGANQQLTVGFDLRAATVTAAEVAVVVGAPMDPVHRELFAAQPVLDALSAGIRAIPAALVQFTPPNFNLPRSIAPTYQPPNDSIFDPRALFTLEFDVTTIAVRPVDAARPGPGALAIGVDLSVPTDAANAALGVNLLGPIASHGDAQRLADLNTVPAANPVMVSYENDGSARFAPGGGTSAQNSDLAVAVNTDWLWPVINGALAWQLGGVFPPALSDDQVSFTEDVADLNVYFGAVTAPLDGPMTPPIPNGIAMSGISADIALTRWQQVTRDAQGYYHGVGDTVGNADVSFSIDIVPLLQTFSRRPEPPVPGPGTRFTVSVLTAPPGNCVYLQGGPIPTGVGPGAVNGIDLPRGSYSIGADASVFGSWSTQGAVTVADAGANPTDLIVAGAGTLTLNATGYNPYVSADFWSLAVVGVDVQLPFWLTLIDIGIGIASFVNLTLMLSNVGYAMYEFDGGFDFANFLDSLISSTAIDSEATTQGLAGVVSALGSFTSYGRAERVTRLPGTSAPDWLTGIDDICVDSGGIATYVSTAPAPYGIVNGATGSYPYLMVVDRAVTSAAQVSDVPGVLDGYYPVRVDGASFTWPGITWGTGEPVPSSIEIAATDLAPITVVLKIPDGMLPAHDPTAVVEWTVERTDTHETLIASTVPVTAGDAALLISIDHASAALQAADAFTLRCQLSRRLATGGLEPIFDSGTLSIIIGDWYDRHHPYFLLVRDSAFVYPGQPFWNATPVHQRGLRWVKRRSSSRIHRTDYWHGGHRCLVADAPYGSGARHEPHQRNRALPAQSPGVPTGGWNYLDTLPVSLDAVRRDRDLARGLLCDYCFFGGPTRTALRDDFPDGP